MTHHSRPDSWLDPRPYTDASLRRRKHGNILPMLDEPRFTLKSLILAGLSGLCIMIGFFGCILIAAVMMP